MNRRLKPLLVLLLVVLIPLRALAAVLMPCCSAASTEVQQHAVEASENAPCHEAEPSAQAEADSGCGFCAVHCASAAQVLIQGDNLLPGAAAPDRIDFVARFLPGFIPGHLERPPHGN